MRRCTVALISLVAAACAPAIQLPPTPATTGQHTIVASGEDIAWSPAPPVLPAGARVVVLEGNPEQPGPFTFRLSMPANYLVPPHFHNVSERFTVLSGRLHLGMGQVTDMSTARELRAGGFAVVPAAMPHFLHTLTETVIEVHTTGPFQGTYVNPADDPRNR
jgi:mannose-6-phosphate isomerase-like protein (cupin superfamily)